MFEVFIALFGVDFLPLLTSSRRPFANLWAWQKTAIRVVLLIHPIFNACNFTLLN